MSGVDEQSVNDDRKPMGGARMHPCEFERAYAELVKQREPGVRPAMRSCSDTGSDERSFPVSPSGKPYFLCNGHLRDLFEALDRVQGRESKG